MKFWGVNKLKWEVSKLKWGVYKKDGFMIRIVFLIETLCKLYII